MASSLGLELPDDLTLPPNPEVTAQVSDAIHHAQEKEQKQQALIRALLPYLRPGRQRRLERAMQVAQLSHLAGAALKSNGVFKFLEDDSHV